MSLFQWREVVAQSGGVVAPDERLPWPQTAALGVQHVIAMFGATVLAPLLMGFDPNLAILMSGIGTLIFFLVTGGRVPSYLGSSFAFIGVVIAATGYAGKTGPNANLGVALARTPDKEGAVTAFKRAVELEPQNGEAHFNLATGYRRLRKTDDAIAEYEKAISLDPRISGAHYDLGVLYSQLKEYEKALAAFRSYLKSGGSGLRAEDRKDAEERIKSLETATKK